MGYKDKAKDQAWQRRYIQATKAPGNPIGEARRARWREWSRKRYAEDPEYRAQIMLKYGAEQNTANIEEVLIPLEYMAYEDYREHPYPNYAAVLPKKKSRRPVEYIGMSLDLLAGLRGTFYELPQAIRFLFHGELNGVGLYDGQGDRFLGLVMPCRVDSGAPDLMFDIKEIERAAPKENEEPTQEDLGQQNLVDQAAQGPVGE